MIKDSNSIIRGSCVEGISKLGPSCLRSLSIVLLDPDITVRNIAENSIEKMDLNTILNEFKDKPHQKFSLRNTLKGILEKNKCIKNPVRKLFKSVIEFENN